jgi:gas vesicle protein
MDNETQVPKYHKNNSGGVFTGLLIGGLAGALTALLLAPQSGEETRRQIREKGIELRDRTTELADRLTIEGREKFKELKQQGQDLAVEQLDRVSDAAQAGKRAIQSPSAA